MPYLSFEELLHPSESPTSSAMASHAPVASMSLVTQGIEVLQLSSSADHQNTSSSLVSERKGPIPITTRSTLEHLYTYNSSAILEYPITSSNGRIGHLIPVAPGSEMRNPLLDSTYSWGAPEGSAGGRSCYLLLDGETNEQVPCRKLTKTCVCSGNKTCKITGLILTSIL